MYTEDYFDKPAKVKAFKGSYFNLTKNFLLTTINKLNNKNLIYNI